MVRSVIPPLVGLGALLLIWWVAALVVGPLRLPTPAAVAVDAFPLLVHSDVLAPQFGSGGGIGLQLLISLGKLLGGAGIGLLAGAVLGVLMSYFRVVGWLLEIPTSVLRSVPPLALVPFILIWMGTGLGGELLLVSLYVGLITLANTLNAITNVPIRHERYAAALGARRLGVERTVILPAIVPEMVGGLRVAVAFSWGLLVVAESLGGTNGIGQALTTFVAVFDAAGIIVSILWVVVLATLIDRLLVVVLRRLLRWSATATAH
jgi:ABC-type nitrate/sulfonate/bicarbonate transport system permease component